MIYEILSNLSGFRKSDIQNTTEYLGSPTSLQIWGKSDSIAVCHQNILTENRIELREKSRFYAAVFFGLAPYF